MIAGRRLDIVGIDPSLNATGISTFGQDFTLKQKAKDGDFRLINIYMGVSAHIATADLVVMEDLPRNAMGAGITGMVQGVVRMACMDSQVPYLTTSPATLKKFATGKGNALKPAMRAAYLELHSVDNPDDNQVDAAFLRLMGEWLAGNITQLRPHWQVDEKTMAKWVAVSDQIRVRA